MTHAVDAALVVQMVSSFLYIALGVWVLTLRPRRRQTVLLGLFAVSFGMVFAPLNILMLFDLVEGQSLTQQILQAPLQLVTSLLLLALVVSIPRPLVDIRLLWITLGIGIFWEAISWLVQVFAPVPLELELVLGIPNVVLNTAILLLVMRAHPRRARESNEVVQLTLLVLALASLFAFVGGMRLPAMAESFSTGDLRTFVQVLIVVMFWVLVAGLCGWNMVRAEKETERIHRTAMLGVLGLVAAGAVYQVLFPGVNPGHNIMRGVMRTLGVGLLAYGILRHDLAGLDAKVRWGVSKTTVAGVFIATFFVAGELAESFFGEILGSQYVGVLAAGLLVFFLAPIQRVADQIAARAVPADSGPVPLDAEETYRVTVGKFLADGEINRSEERHLARLAARLGIDAERAFEIHDEVLNAPKVDG